MNGISIDVDIDEIALGLNEKATIPDWESFVRFLDSDAVECLIFALVNDMQANKNKYFCIAENMEPDEIKIINDTLKFEENTE